MEHFCNCVDLECPLHPRGHDKGCDPCIRKNLKMGEVPTCLFRAVSDDVSSVTDYTIEGFVDFYQKNQKNG